MVNYLNPRPVVYDFCKSYFAHWQLCIFFTAENPILITQHLYTCISNYFFFYGRPNILHPLGFTVPWREAFLFKFNQELMQQWWTYIFSHIWTNILQSFHVISNGRFLVVQLGVSWAADVQGTGSSLGWLHLCPKQYHPFILQTSRKRGSNLGWLHLCLEQFHPFIYCWRVLYLGFFSVWKLLYFILNFTEVYSQGLAWQKASFGWDNGFVLYRCQAIIETDDGWF